MSKRVLGSLARIADFDKNPFEVGVIPRSNWETGDYVQGEVVGEPTRLYQVECTTGEMIAVDPGDEVIGAFGHRAATLEGVGSWMEIDGGEMNAMTSAGLFGRFTSISRLLPRPMSLKYTGHVMRSGRKIRMRDFAIAAPPRELRLPAILMVGTSMSAGKTMTGKFACQILSDLGYRVIGTKLTGAGRYRDILSFRDHGAAEIYDFVDAGLSSTVVAEDEFRAAIRPLLSHIAGRDADFMVVEAGASPLEPYNGAAAIDELGANIRCRILCATDPYAVVGVQKAYGLRPDLVAGPATNTTAALDLVEKLTGLPGINIIDPEKLPVFRDFLVHILQIEGAATQAPRSA
ncbi:MAG: hypothetical protein OEV10_11475 [Gammaproteobacteria bacterium]|jgi:hypothetical protein|nr:hypothetical protein [Gammaproteobacteria bacterium]MDH3864575.1 hypothetical protein [Gammaproteobacteria bacterium]MDH3906887.1 hypothetical protein [Gammaproteobacteria bacterium]MDH3954347.1 hypothetical protein [Gammaproteobacteria bacterium]MDH4004742.1 hypothetical protein [Gammaproteobacteria bacterium]